MITTILGVKSKQTQVFTSDGKRIPVTVVKTADLPVVWVKNKEKDGYSAVIVGFGQKRTKLISKPILGTLKKAGLEKNPPRFLKELRVDDAQASKMSIGTLIKISEIIKEGDFVSVRGVSKGKGFQGGVKRHHFKGGPRTHGQSDRERAPGSIGQTTTPGRVYKGKRMAGRMGGDNVTINNLQVVSIDDSAKTITVKGLVPGALNGLLIIKKVNH